MSWKIWYESSDVGQTFLQSSKFFEISWRLHLLVGIDFLRVDVDSFGCYNEPKEFATGCPMKDLVGFIFSWCAHMMSNTIFRSAMWLLLSRLFTAISSTFAYMLLEDRIHCSLICCPLHSLIRKASWCSNTPPMAFWRMYAFSSSRYILIWLYPEKFIHKRHSLETAYVVNHDIRDRERELVFGRSGVQIVKVDADLDLPVLLGDRNDVVYPVKVLFFPDVVRVWVF